MISTKVWYVTGASQGLGLILVKKLLENGYRVAATSRDAHALAESVHLIDKDRFLPPAVDLTNPDGIDESIQQTLTVFGRIDVVVNNAGYGMAGTIEETTEQDIRNIFNVNVLATMSVVKSVLPVMRSQRSGHIMRAMKRLKILKRATFLRMGSSPATPNAQRKYLWKWLKARIRPCTGTSAMMPITAPRKS